MQRFLSLTLLAQGAVAGLYPGLTTANHTCSLASPLLSCTEGANPDFVDSCCVETFGGLVLATQFWNTYTGFESKDQVLPQESWSIHGLWPDFCNGSYTQYCDLSRQYDPEPSPTTVNGEPDGVPVPPYKGEPIPKLMAPFERHDLLAYMRKHWVGQNQWSWKLWAHEFSKHATCFSTYDVECYGPQYVENEDMIDFFETVVAYQIELPTYRWLADAGIVPSNKTHETYSLSAIQGALINEFGAVPFVGCSGPKYNETKAGKGSDDDGATVLSEMWYYHHVFGKSQRVDGVPVDADASYRTTCAQAPGAIRYPERSHGSEA